MKIPEYGTTAGASDWSESKAVRCEDEPLEMKSEQAKRAVQSANQKLVDPPATRTPSFGIGTMIIWHIIMHIC